MIQVEHRAYQRYQREDGHHTAYHLINNKNAIGIKLAAYLVDEPAEAIDTLYSNDVAGTIAGDNTIFVLVRTDEKAVELISKVRKMIS